MGDFSKPQKDWRETGSLPGSKDIHQNISRALADTHAEIPNVLTKFKEEKQKLVEEAEKKRKEFKVLVLDSYNDFKLNDAPGGHYYLYSFKWDKIHQRLDGDCPPIASHFVSKDTIVAINGRTLEKHFDEVCGGKNFQFAKRILFTNNGNDAEETTEMQDRKVVGTAKLFTAPFVGSHVEEEIEKITLWQQEKEMKESDKQQKQLKVSVEEELDEEEKETVAKVYRKNVNSNSVAMLRFLSPVVKGKKKKDETVFISQASIDRTMLLRALDMKHEAADKRTKAWLAFFSGNKYTKKRATRNICPLCERLPELRTASGKISSAN